AGFFLFVLVHVHACAGLQAAEVLAGEASVRGEAGQAEVDRTFPFVGVAGGHQALDPGHHVGDEVGGADDVAGRLDAQTPHVGQEGVGVDVGVGAQFLAGLARAGDHFVVHVGDVHHRVHIEPLLRQKALQDVHPDEGAEVADMAVVVDGQTAGVHADLAGGERHQRLHAAGEGVIELNGHAQGKLYAGWLTRIDAWIGTHNRLESGMRVCVVIPAYNEARNLPVLLPRVFAQAEFLPGWELSVLVVDDDSTDGTRAVLAEMQTRYPALYV